MVRPALVVASTVSVGYAAVCQVAGGSSDDSAAIKAALNSCNEGGTVVINQIYTIGSLLQTTDLHDVTIKLTGTINLSADIDYSASNGLQLNYQKVYTAWTIGGGNSYIHGGKIYCWSGDTWYNNIKQGQSPFWHNIVYGSHNVAFTNINLHCTQTFGKQAQNTDGWDIYRRETVSILNSTIVNGDDCVSFKPNTTNALIQNLHCQISHGISVGSLGHYAGVQDIVANILVKNVPMVNVENGACIKTFSGSASPTSTTGGGSGYVKNIGAERQSAHCYRPVLPDFCSDLC